MGLYVESIVGYAILYEKEILSLSGFFFNFELNFHHISAGVAKTRVAGQGQG